MIKKDVLFLSLVIVLAAALIVPAQNTPTKSHKSTSVSIQQTMNVLYDQTADPGPNGSASQNFEAAYDQYDCQEADDFTVPAGVSWSIETIDILGVYWNGTGPANSFNVWFYNDNGGLPGTVAGSEMNASFTDPSGTGSPTITLSTPITLPAGDYWMSIQANMDYGTGGQWGWTDQGQSGNVSKWQNPGGGFATSCSSWGDRVATCGIGAAPYNDASFTLNGTEIVPVELTSFRAYANNNIVIIDWTTATETNNRGFELQRKTANGQYATVSFLEGHGTTTLPHQYSYMDKNLTSGNYTYRLKQIDFDGTSKLSKEVEVKVNAPDVYSLQQNYPNPFNPSTKIDFSLANESKVTLKIYNVLGQQVVELLNSNFSAGQHSITFDASNLNSGVYFYKLEATGNNGTNFNSIKKMILTK